MKKSILILGAGRMVRAMVYDLHRDFKVTVADINKDALAYFKTKYNVNTLVLNVTNANALGKAVQPFDLVIGAVPGHLGFAMLQTVIKAGKNIVDISFSPENALLLQTLAEENSVFAFVDFGVAPGLSNLLLGKHYHEMKVDKFLCQVGGLPVAKTPPYFYKAPFSPIDVIEEYTRPARIKRQGEIITLPALSENKRIHFNAVGELDSFITDGLRSLLTTVEIDHLEEKTLRYPGHREIMKTYRDTGFFSKKPIRVAEKEIVPLDVTAAVLLPHWKLEENEPEFTLMQIDILGAENGKEVHYQYILLDYFNAETGLSSMARTTGFTCAAGARLALQHPPAKGGIYPPELLPQHADFVLNHIKTHGVAFTKTKK